MKPQTGKAPVSDCHQAPIKIGGGVGDFHDNDKVITQYCICTKCDQPCNIYNDLSDSQEPAQTPPTSIDKDFYEILASVYRAGGLVKPTTSPKSEEAYMRTRKYILDKATTQINHLLTSAVIDELEGALVVLTSHAKPIRENAITYLEERLATLKSQLERNGK